MIIWIVSDGEPLPSDGNDVRLRRMGILANILVDRNHEVHWFSSTFHHYKKEHRASGDMTLKISSNYYIHLIKTEGYLKNVSYSRLQHFRRLSAKFVEIVKEMPQPDFILSTLAPLELSTAVSRYSSEREIPYIIDVRDLWPEIYYEAIPKILTPIIYPYVQYSKRKLMEILKKSYGIVGVTEGFLNYGLNIAKLNKRESDRVFHTSYVSKNYAEKKEIFEEIWGKYKINGDDFIVTFIGNFGKQFELDPLIETIHNLKDYNIKIVLCGTGEKFENFNEIFKYNSNVILPGWIEEDMISTLLAVTSVGIAPYKNSKNFTLNTPNKFGEYLSASIPVLVSVTGVMEDLLNEYNAGGHYNDARELTNQILEFFNNREKLEDNRKNANKLFNERFDARTVYNEFANYVEKIQ